MIAKFLDMDVADIIVIKGKLKDIQACESVVYAEDDEEISEIDLDGDKKTKHTPMCKNAQQFTRKVIYNEWSRHFDKPNKDAPIQSLREFLLYLPLFDLTELSVFVYRTMGDVCDNMGYGYDRLQCLSERKGDTKAKRYADHMKYFCLKEPNVNRVTEEDMHVLLIQEKYEEYRKYVESESYEIEQEAYITACKQASERFAFVYKLKYQLDELMKSQIDYTTI